MTISTNGYAGASTPTSATAGKPPYRADIDGLRAAAVLLVAIFHASPEILPGGFAGVDIFFVISGFLITGIISSDIGKGTFSLTGFYSRRCRRILPALLLVMGATGFAGYFLLFADDYRLLGKHMTAGACFFSNLTFFREAGYFDTIGISKPLLHLWSLAVEEQFYLLWQVILWLAVKRKSGPTAATTLLCCSLAAGLLESLRSTDAAFYLLPFRLWELMAGCLIALKRPVSYSGQNSFPAKIIGIAPAIMLAAFLFLLDFKTFSPVKLILPVGAAALYISNGPSALPNRILSRNLFVWLGKISYPFYLWHWPLLSFGYLVRGGSVRWETRYLLVALSLILADLTWRLVEKPTQKLLFEDYEPKIRNRAWVSGGLTALTLISVSGLLIKHGTIMSIWQRRTEGLAAYRDYTERIPPLFFELRDIQKPDYSKISFPKLQEGKPAVIILGDSIADRMAYGLGQYLEDYRVPVYSLTASACPPLLDVEWAQCREFNRRTLSFLRNRRQTVVILASAWQVHYKEPSFRAHLEHTLLSLQEIGVGSIIVAGQTPQWDRPLYKILMKEADDSSLPWRTHSGVLASIFGAETALRSNIPTGTAEFAPILGTFCNTDGCLVRLGKRVSTDLVAFDNGHPTTTASRYIADTALGPAVLKALGKLKPIKPYGTAWHKQIARRLH